MATAKLLEVVESGDPTERFILDAELAVGSFGTVYRARDKILNQTMAVKIIALEEDDSVDDLVSEIAILKLCSHDNIVRYFGSYMKGKEIFIGMELCTGGSLLEIYDDFPKNEVPCNEAEIAFVLRESLKGLQYLHDNLVIHRDLKAANILVSDKGHVKLADFGVSAQVTFEKPYRTTLIGTPYWMAPEVINMDSTSPYDYRADIWSLGITAIELAEKNPPLVELAPMRALCTIPFDPPPTLKQADRWTKEFKSFLQACLQKDPAQRKNCKELLQHPFITGSAKKDLSELLLKHKKLKEDAEQNSQEVTKKWEAFLGELEQKKSGQNSVPMSPGSSMMITVPHDDEDEVTLEEYPSGTMVVSKKQHQRNLSEDIPDMMSENPLSLSSPGPTTPRQEAHVAATIKRTIIDPSTARPKTFRVDDSSRQEEAQRLNEKLAVKQQLRELRKIQQNHSKMQEQLDYKHNLQKENLTREFQNRFKALEKTRVEVDAHTSKTMNGEKDLLVKEHQNQIKNLQKQLQTEERTKKKDLADRQKGNAKDNKERLKLQHKQSKSNLKDSGNKKKEVKDLDDEHEKLELQFTNSQVTEKLLDGHKFQESSVDRHLYKQREQMREVHKHHLRSVESKFQLASDTLLLNQELDREFKKQIFLQEETHLTSKHQLQRAQLTEIFHSQREGHKKAMKNYVKIESKKFKLEQKAYLKDFSSKESDLKKQLTKEPISKKELSQILKEKRDHLKETLIQKEKEFEKNLQASVNAADEQQRKTEERQLKGLHDTQEKEMMALQKKHIQLERAQQQEQHDIQVKALKDHMDNLLVICKQQLVEEEEFQRQYEAQTLQQLADHHKAHLQLLREHHVSEHNLWRNLKRSPDELFAAQQNEIKEANTAYTNMVTKYQEKLSGMCDDVQKRSQDYIASLEKNFEARFAELDLLHKQQKHSKEKQLMERDLQNSMNFSVNNQDGEGQTKLHVAAMEGNVEAARNFISDGGNVNLQDKNKWTALHVACSHKRKDFLQFLLSQPDLNISAINESGSTALHYLCKNFDFSMYNEDKEKIVSQMVQRNPRLLSTRNKSGETVLHSACVGRNMSIARALVALGADVNVCTEGGDAPLHYAAQVNDLDMATFLLKSGANPNLKGRHGTPAEIAQMQGRTDIINILAEYQRQRTASSANNGHYAPLQPAQRRDTNPVPLDGSRSPPKSATPYSAVRSPPPDNGVKSRSNTGQSSVGIQIKSSQEMKLPTYTSVLPSTPKALNSSYEIPLKPEFSNYGTNPTTPSANQTQPQPDTLFFRDLPAPPEIPEDELPVPDVAPPPYSVPEPDFDTLAVDNSIYSKILGNLDTIRDVPTAPDFS